MADKQIDQILDKFKLGKKWFWIGVVMALLNVAGGLVYGITLATEKKHRQEGLIIILVAIVWAVAGYFLIGPWLIKAGLVPKYTLMRLK